MRGYELLASVYQIWYAAVTKKPLNQLNYTFHLKWKSARNVMCFVPAKQYGYNQKQDIKQPTVGNNVV